MLGIRNDVRAVRKGRIANRIWNRWILRIARKFFK